MEKLTNAKAGGASTHKYVDVAEVHDGVVVMRNGSLRAILMMSSINFDLKSSDEQDAIILQYQNFLNSLDFPLQVVVSSRKLNIGPYIQVLNDRERRTESEALRLQIAEYRAFIKNLTEITNIMSKFFYVVVPFSPVESEENGFFGRIMASLHPAEVVTAKREKFETYKNQLFQRVDHVSSAVSATGVRAIMLTTEEILELLYNAYNPSLFTNASLSELDQVKAKGL